MLSKIITSFLCPPPLAGYIFVFLSGLICNFLLASFIEQKYSWVW
jgi:hypothetical protein